MIFFEFLCAFVIAFVSGFVILIWVVEAFIAWRERRAFVRRLNQ